MLRSLRVRDFAVLAEVGLDLGPGLSAFTGETGAGKSLLIEALGFLLGGRGGADWIRAKAPRLEVRGTFDAADAPEGLRRLLGADGPELALRRELDRTGRTRAFVNGRPVPAARLAELGAALADFHGQHEHQSLLRPAVQLELLDGYGGLEALRAGAARAHGEHRRLQAALEALSMSEAERLRAIDLARFQAGEIDAAAPRLGEDDELEAELPRLKNAARLMELSALACDALSRREGSAEETLSAAAKAASEIARLDGSLADVPDALEAALERAREAFSRLSDYGRGFEEGGGRLDEVMARLDVLSRLKKKYGPTLADVMARGDEAAAQLSALEGHEARAGDARAALDKARAALAGACDRLHDARMKAARRLSAKAGAELRDLGMPGARFTVAVELEEGAFTPTGADRVEFLIAPNPGEPMKPLRSIASGGELSRAMLALKTVLCRQDRVGLLVFDEVDSGVDGRTARAVGSKLAELGRSRQVLCVTHLPQVACFAGVHFEVSKRTSGGRTQAGVERLDGERRLPALGRMLGGRLTDTSLKHARELLEGAGKAGA